MYLIFLPPEEQMKFFNLWNGIKDRFGFMTYQHLYVIQFQIPFIQIYIEYIYDL